MRECGEESLYGFTLYKCAVLYLNFWEPQATPRTTAPHAPASRCLGVQHTVSEILGLRRRFEPPLTTHDGRTYDPLTFHSHTHIHTNTHATPITSLEELNPESLSA